MGVWYYLIGVMRFKGVTYRILHYPEYYILEGVWDVYRDLCFVRISLKVKALDK